MINKIAIANWMGYEKFETEFKLGKNLVYGRNASGKSSIAKAIAYSLSGILPLPKNCDPRRDPSKECVVDLSVTAKDGKRYLVRRQIGKGSRGKPTIFIYEEADPSDALYTSEDAEQFLQQIIGLSGEVFERIIYMKEEDVHEFLAKPTGAVLHEIDKLIGLKKAHDFGRDVEEISSEIKRSLKDTSNEIKETRIAIKKGMGVVKGTVDIKKAESRLAEIKEIQEELMTLKGFLEKREGIREDLNSIREKAEEPSLEKLEAKLIEVQMEIESDKSSLETTIQSDQNEIKALEGDLKKKEAKMSLKEDIVINLEAEEEKISECPTCGREMDEELLETTVTKLKNEIEKFQTEIKKQVEKIKKGNESMAGKERKLKQLEEKLEHYKELKGETTRLLEDFRSNESLIGQFKDKKYPQTATAIETKLEGLFKEAEEINKDIGRAEGAQQVTEQRIKTLQEREDEMKHSTKVIKLISEAIQKTAQVLRKEYSSKVKNQAEAIWEQYKGEPWEIDWDEDFVPIAKSRTSERKQAAYEMSGSERFLILLAIRLSMLQTLDQFQLLIIDEPCQHLDDENGKAFRDIITSLDEKNIQQSIVFTYNQDYLEGNWSNIVKLS